MTCELSTKHNNSFFYFVQGVRSAPLWENAKQEYVGNDFFLKFHICFKEIF